MIWLEIFIQNNSLSIEKGLCVVDSPAVEPNKNNKVKRCIIARGGLDQESRNP